MAWDLAGNARDEIRRARFIEALGPERAAELLPLAGSEPTILSGARTGRRRRSRRRLPSPASASGRLGPRRRRLRAGSSPRASARRGISAATPGSSRARAPRAASRSSPTIRISGCARRRSGTSPRSRRPACVVTGATLPGVPGVLIGHNDRIAWGLTSLEPDVQDLFVEEVDPEDAVALSPPRGVEALRGAPRDDPRARRRGRELHGARLGPRSRRHGRPRRRRPARPGRGPALDGSGPDPGSTEAFLAIGHGPQLGRVSCRRRGAPGLVAEPGLRRRRGPHRLRGRRARCRSGRAPTGSLPVSGDGEDDWAGMIPLREPAAGRSIPSAATSSRPTTA